MDTTRGEEWEEGFAQNPLCASFKMDFRIRILVLVLLLLLRLRLLENRWTKGHTDRRWWVGVDEMEPEMTSENRGKFVGVELRNRDGWTVIYIIK